MRVRNFSYVILMRLYVHFAACAVAKWLMSEAYISLISGLRIQIEQGCQDEYTNVSISALKVVEYLIDSQLGSRVMEDFYSSLVFLLNFPDLRHWSLNVMIKLYYSRSNEHVVKLLQRGFIEALFNSVIFLREFPRLSDPFCHLSDVEIIYHLDGLTDVINVLLHVLDISPASLRYDKEQFPKIRLTAFHVHHVEMVRCLHLLICSELELGKLDGDDPSLRRLAIKLEQLLTKMNVLHAQSAIHNAVNIQVTEILSSWNLKLNEARSRGHERRVTQSVHMTVEEVKESSAALLPKRLVLHNAYIGGQEIEVLVTPWEWYYEGSIRTPVLREERLFLFPLTVNLMDMYSALSNHYAYVIRLYYSKAEHVTLSSGSNIGLLVFGCEANVANAASGTLVPLMEDSQLQRLIGHTKEILYGSSRPRIHLFVQPPKVATAPTGAHSKPKLFSSLSVPEPLSHARARGSNNSGSLTSDLWKLIDINLPEGTSINEHFVTELYKLFHISCDGKEEIDVDLFARLMSQREIPEQVSRPLFRVFDRDGSGSLSWREIILGLAKVKSPKHRLAMAFNAFDADGDGQLDFEETVELCHAHLPKAGVETAQALAGDCFTYLHLQAPSQIPHGVHAKNSKMNFKQFEELLNSHKITLDTLLPDSLSHGLFTEFRSNRVPVSRSSNLGDDSIPTNLHSSNHKKCRVFLNGDCKFGSSCRYVHDLNNTANTVGTSMLPSGAEGSQTEYTPDYHGGTSFSAHECHRYGRGQEPHQTTLRSSNHSNTGREQTYSSPTRANKLCRDFVQLGNCKFGGGCKFLHGERFKDAAGEQ
jgi:Ca2+-binding EF-hand superfamily protein